MTAQFPTLSPFPRAALSLLLLSAAAVAVPALGLAPLAARAQQTEPSAAAAPATAPVPQAQEKLRDGDLVAMCGDSITENRMYTLYMTDYLMMCQPAANLHTIQAGWAGEWTSGFLARMKSNVLDLKPTVATTSYGMHDGAFKRMSPQTTAAYKNNMTSIVKQFKEGGVRFIIVGSPSAVDTTSYRTGGITADEYNTTLAALANAAREVAAEQGVAFADVHTLMKDVMARVKAQRGKDYLLAGGDGINPGPNGHLVIAYAYLKAMGCDGNIGTITVDLGNNTAEGSDGHKVLSTSGHRTEVLSTRYPFCFPKQEGNVPGDAAISILDYLPFQQDLNRYLLVVKNPPAGLAFLNITWGDKTKMFPVADLAKGVNLAAEFPDSNPFCGPFNKVHKALRDQQGTETQLIKNMLNAAQQWRKQLPDDPEADAAITALQSRIAHRIKTLREASREQIHPVRHAIVVETK